MYYGSLSKTAINSYFRVTSLSFVQTNPFAVVFFKATQIISLTAGFKCPSVDTHGAVSLIILIIEIPHDFSQVPFLLFGS